MVAAHRAIAKNAESGVEHSGPEAHQRPDDASVDGRVRLKRPLPVAGTSVSAARSIRLRGVHGDWSQAATNASGPSSSAQGGAEDRDGLTVDDASDGQDDVSDDDANDDDDEHYDDSDPVDAAKAAVADATTTVTLTAATTAALFPAAAVMAVTLRPAAKKERPSPGVLIERLQRLARRPSDQ